MMSILGETVLAKDRVRLGIVKGIFTPKFCIGVIFSVDFSNGSLKFQLFPLGNKGFR